MGRAQTYRAVMTRSTPSLPSALVMDYGGRLAISQSPAHRTPQRSDTPQVITLGLCWCFLRHVDERYKESSSYNDNDHTLARLARFNAPRLCSYEVIMRRVCLCLRTSLHSAMNSSSLSSLRARFASRHSQRRLVRSSVPPRARATTWSSCASWSSLRPVRAQLPLWAFHIEARSAAVARPTPRSFIARPQKKRRA